MTRLFVLAAALAAPSDPPPDESEPSGSDASSPDVTKTPELTTFVEAEYPESARAEGRVGTVGLVFTIQADGTVTDIEVSSSAGADLDAAAVAAVTQFVFSPALIDDEPGAVRIRYDYAFTLETKVEEVPIPEPEIPSGVLRGQLLERGTRAPLPGMEIRLPALGSEAFTDAEGRFEFEAVPAGTVTIIVRDPLYAELEDEETVMTGQATEVTYYLERTGFEDGITVVGRRPKKQVVRRTLTIQEIRTIPGPPGDALKVIQNLPGVARQVISDEIVLRGGGRSQAFVDQHPIPLAFHFGGLRSTVSSGLIENIDLYPGNFGAEYGRLNGGIIEIGLRSPRTDGYHGFIEADFFDAGFLLEGPIDEHWSFAWATSTPRRGTTTARCWWKASTGATQSARWGSSPATCSRSCSPAATRVTPAYASDRTGRAPGWSGPSGPTSGCETSSASPTSSRSRASASTSAGGHRWDWTSSSAASPYATR